MKKTIFSVQFLIRGSRILRNGEARIYLKIRVDNQVVEHTLSRSIPPDQWDAGRGMAMAKSDRGKALNHYLEHVRKGIYDAQLALEDRQQEVTAELLMQESFGSPMDRLICLGDVADRNPEVAQCFTKLLKVINLVYILGNHDWWLLQWFREQRTESMWLWQGGKYSIASYQKPGLCQPKVLIRKHLAFLENALLL